MENKEFVPMERPVEDDSASKNKRLSGRNSKQKRTDKFRYNVGKRQLAELKEQARERLFGKREPTSELDKAYDNIDITIIDDAVPLALSTRGVGFAVATEYNRMCSVLTIEQVQSICTIYQYYRVAMYLAYYKSYLARIEQSEPLSFDVSSEFTISSEIQQVLAPVCEVPVPTFNVLSAIGKIEGSSIWHSLPMLQAPSNGEQMALYLYPSNISGCLDQLSDPDFDPVARDAFYQLNPLPGALWEQDHGSWLLANPDQIWPEDYSVRELATDVKAYKQLVASCTDSFPPGFVARFTWSGRAAKTGLVCLKPLPVSLQSHFSNALPPPREEELDHRGEPILAMDPAPDLPRYQSVTFDVKVRAECWSLEDTTGLESTVGAASLVGECSLLSTQFRIQGVSLVNLAPLTILKDMVTVPRSSAT